MNRNYPYHKNYHAGLVRECSQGVSCICTELINYKYQGNGEPTKLRRRHDAKPPLTSVIYRHENSRLRARTNGMNADNNNPPVAVVVEDGPYFSILVWLLCTITFVLVILFLQEVFHPNNNSQSTSTNNNKSKSSHKSKQKNSNKKERSRKHKIDEYYDDDYYCFSNHSNRYTYTPQQQQQQYQYNFNDMSIDSSMYYRTHARKRASSNTNFSVNVPTTTPQTQQPQHILNVPPNTCTNNSAVLPSSKNNMPLNNSNLPGIVHDTINASPSTLTNLDIEYGSSDDAAIAKFTSHEQENAKFKNSTSTSTANIHPDMEQPNNANLAGEVTLSEIIGEGGFGSVWRGDWRGTPVAIKMLTLPPRIAARASAHVVRDDDIQDASSTAAAATLALEKLKTFQSEMNLLKSLRHPNICMFLGYIRKGEASDKSTSPSTWGLVMELCEHGSLWDALRRPLPPNFNFHVNHNNNNNNSLDTRKNVPMDAPFSIWPNELILRVASGAARGIAYLHSRNPPILHRDLKSANILLDASFHVKIADFGLSTILNDASQEGDDSSPLTQNCGTVQWMAPEVLLYSSSSSDNDNTTTYGPPADVYSYAIILWELVTQECPFESSVCSRSRNDPLQVALAVIQRDVRPVVPRWVCEQYRNVILGCWKRDAAKRMSLEEVLGVLNGLAEVGGGGGL